MVLRPSFLTELRRRRALLTAASVLLLAAPAAAGAQSLPLEYDGAAANESGPEQWRLDSR